ncbi:16S rRNA processing protein RimM [Helicobacter enhydrae]|uniref:Ribosome maturation factor RimM n=2 Tax=Helicobacter enhydrae TaxID=222136 RepID=A0A1B1U562_9HELI|nr:16S rRNA processing protein RimM [Helicobacter enhydrae]
MIQVAKIGKTTGVFGGVKLHLLTDFPEIFQSQIVFYAKSPTIKQEALSLKLKSYHQQVAIFEGYESVESAKKLTNFALFVSLEDTRKYCQLGDDEAFYFDVIGCEIVENEEILGYVKEVERIANTDYLMIDASRADHSVEAKMPKHFMIPYIDRYIVGLDLKQKKILTKDAKDIWKSS